MQRSGNKGKANNHFKKKKNKKEEEPFCLYIKYKSAKEKKKFK